jgi:Na+(H+)/acetate symporter ActP
MIAATYVIACLTFYAAFQRFGLVTQCMELLATFRAAALLISDDTLNEREKETRIRESAITALGKSVGLFTRTVAVLTAAGLPVALSMVVGLDLTRLMAFSLSPVVLSATVVALFTLARLQRLKTG